MQLKESIVLRSSRFTGSGSEVCGIAVLTGIGDTVGCVVSMAAFFSASVCVALPGVDVGSSGSAGVGVGFSVGLGVGVESSGWSCKIRPMFWFGIPPCRFPIAHHLIQRRRCFDVGNHAGGQLSQRFFA